MLDQIVNIVAIILGSTHEIQDRAAKSVGLFLAESIPGDQVEDDLARFMEKIASELRSQVEGS